MKLASMILTFDMPLNLRRHKASNSLDSGDAVIQCAGGCSQRSQLKKVPESECPDVYTSDDTHSLQMCKVASLCKPSVMSTVSLTQSLHSAPAAEVPSMGEPQLQHKMLEGCQHVLLQKEHRVTTWGHFVGLKVWKAVALAHQCP